MDKRPSVSYHPETSVGDGAQLWQLTPYPPPLHFLSSPTHIWSQQAVLGLVQLQVEGLMPSNRQADLPLPLLNQRGCVTLAVPCTDTKEGNFIVYAH